MNLIETYDERICGYIDSAHPYSRKVNELTPILKDAIRDAVAYHENYIIVGSFIKWCVELSNDWYKNKEWRKEIDKMYTMLHNLCTSLEFIVYEDEITYEEKTYAINEINWIKTVKQDLEFPMVKPHQLPHRIYAMPNKLFMKKVRREKRYGLNVDGMMRFITMSTT